MKITKGILVALLMGSMTFLLSGCSLGDTWDLLWSHTAGSSDEDSDSDVYDEDSITVSDDVEAPVFTTDLEGSVSYAVGDEAEALEVKAEIEGEGKITYQWYVNTADSNGGGTKIEDATDNKYTPDTSEEGYLYYFVVAKNTIGSSSSMTTSSIVEIFVDPDQLPAGTYEEGWNEDETGTFYVENGEIVVSQWIELEEGTYRVNKEGYMRYGWITVGDDTYYMKEDGTRAEYFLTIDEEIYYFDKESGALQYGWLEVDGNTYYADLETGIVNVGWLDGDGSMFYCNEDGVVYKDEWLQIDGYWYYFNEDGVMLTNASHDGKWLNPDGRLAVD